MRSHALLTRIALFLFVVATIFSLAKIHAAVVGNYDLTSSNRFIWIILYSVLAFLVAYAYGLPDQRSWNSRIKASLASVMTASLLLAILQVLTGKITLPRFVILLSIPALFLVFVFVSTVGTKMSKTAADRERVLLIVNANDARIITKDIAFHTEVPCVITKHFTVQDARNLTDLSVLIAEQDITLIVLDNNASKDADIISLATVAHSHGVRIRSQLAFYNDWIGKTPVRELGETTLLFDVREIHHVGYSRVSRMLDISVACIGFVALAVVTPFIVLGNLAANRGPLLYAQERVGKGQQSFRILKFRSMIPGASNGEWTKKNDSRITKFGKFLRLSHLDELPQVINILRGDLSIVGPRPEQSHYVNQLAEKIPYYQARHLVRPGLTGWAQVNYPYGANEIDAFEKLQYEFWYLQHQSMWLDIKIITRTFRHVLGFKGR